MRRLVKWWRDGASVTNMGSAEGCWLSPEGSAAIRAALDSRGIKLTNVKRSETKEEQ